jgi:centractin
MVHNLLYDKLRTIPEEHPLLVVESYNSAQNSQEKMVEVLFEHFNFPKLVFVKSPACSLFSQGCTNGIIFECGAGTSVCSPIFDGRCVKEAT